VETDLPCYYSALPVYGVKIGPSPQWLREKLEAVGLRSINNAVDVTNYVMLLFGQPTHVFDAAKVHGKIRVRNARAGEPFLALDGKTYTLTPEDIVIADDQKALAIAGIMGGEESSVTEATTDIILEIAWFDPKTIRRSSRRLGISTDSSYRFERGVDIIGCLIAPEFAGRLIADLTQATGLYKKTSAHNIEELLNRALQKTTVVPLRTGRVRAVMGADIPDQRIDEILTSLGLEKVGGGWYVPSFRQDLTREIDLIEEITRVFGIENIPSREKSRYVESTATDRAHDRNMRLRNALAARGFYEARTLSLVGGQAAQSAAGDILRVRNPLIVDQVVMRPDLLGGLLGVAAGNARAGTKSLRLFELGRVFVAGKNEERTHLAFVTTGPLVEKSWRSGEVRNADVFDLKGVLASLGLGALTFEHADHPSLALAASIMLDGEQIGCVGQLWPAKAREIDITTPVFAVEIGLPEPKTVVKKYREIPRYPAVTRDISMLLPASVSTADVTNVLNNVKEPLLAGVRLFDFFEDKKTVPNQKSMAYSLTYRANDRTLNAEEVNVAHARLKESLKSALNVTFRE